MGTEPSFAPAMTPVDLHSLGSRSRGRKGKVSKDAPSSYNKSRPNEYGEEKEEDPNWEDFSLTDLYALVAPIMTKMIEFGQQALGLRWTSILRAKPFGWIKNISPLSPSTW